MHDPRCYAPPGFRRHFLRYGPRHFCFRRSSTILTLELANQCANNRRALLAGMAAGGCLTTGSPGWPTSYRFGNTRCRAGCGWRSSRWTRRERSASPGWSTADRPTIPRRTGGRAPGRASGAARAGRGRRTAGPADWRIWVPRGPTASPGRPNDLLYVRAPVRAGGGGRRHGGRGWRIRCAAPTRRCWRRNRRSSARSSRCDTESPPTRGSGSCSPRSRQPAHPLAHMRDARGRFGEHVSLEPLERSSHVTTGPSA